jgi:transcription-repair coupling factor (superfamily II helicase)
MSAADSAACCGRVLVCLFSAKSNVERSLKEAASELKARIATGGAQRFPIMGLKGASNALMLREAALAIDRPIVAITAMASEAEALAAEVSFFLDQSTDADAARCKVHLLPGWEVRPFAHLSPPPDIQAAQLASIFALLRTAAPLIVSSVEALSMRTVPRQVFENSVIRIAPLDRLDLEAMTDALAGMGYQRVPQTEEQGDFSVRGGIIDVFSPLHHRPIRIELEDDLVSSIRYFDSGSQRSLGDIDEATIIRTRYIPAAALRDKHLIDRVAVRCAEIGMVRKEAGELIETLENGLLFPGVELISPYLYEHGLEPIFGYLPENALIWMVEPGRILGEAERLAERIAAEASAAHNTRPSRPARW